MATGKPNGREYLFSWRVLAPQMANADKGGWIYEVAEVHAYYQSVVKRTVYNGRIKRKATVDISDIVYSIDGVVIDVPTEGRLVMAIEQYFGPDIYIEFLNEQKNRQAQWIFIDDFEPSQDEGWLTLDCHRLYLDEVGEASDGFPIAAYDRYANILYKCPDVNHGIEYKYEED